MLSASELQIGRKVYLKLCAELQIVTVSQVINETNITVINEENESLNINSADKFSQLYGIPLTEEIIENNGFIREDVDRWVQFRKNSNGIYLRKDDSNIFYMENDDSEIPLEFVHIAQNHFTIKL